MLRLIATGAGLLALGLAPLVSADPAQSANCGDHIHVKGHVRDAQGGGVAGAMPHWGDATGSGAAASRDLPFLQGLPNGCICHARMSATGGDGAFELKIEVSQDPRCTSAVDRITVDRTKLYFRKQGVTIVPAP